MSSSMIYLFDDIYYKNNSDDNQKYNTMIPVQDIDLHTFESFETSETSETSETKDEFITNMEYGNDHFGSFCKKCLSFYEIKHYYKSSKFDILNDDDRLEDMCLGSNLLFIFSGFLYLYETCDEGFQRTSTIVLINKSLDIEDCINKIDKYLKKHVGLYNYSTVLLSKSSMDKLYIHEAEYINTHLIEIMKYLGHISKHPYLGLKFSE